MSDKLSAASKHVFDLLLPGFIKTAVVLALVIGCIGVPYFVFRMGGLQSFWIGIFSFIALALLAKGVLLFLEFINGFSSPEDDDSPSENKSPPVPRSASSNVTVLPFAKR